MELYNWVLRVLTAHPELIDDASEGVHIVVKNDNTVGDALWHFPSQLLNS